MRLRLTSERASVAPHQNQGAERQHPQRILKIEDDDEGDRHHEELGARIEPMNKGIAI